MKIVELTNKIHLPITNEENELLEKFVAGSSIPKSHLDERQQVVANNLTVKDVLTRTNENGKIYYSKRIK